MNFKKQGVLLGVLLLVWCFTLAAKDPEKTNKEKTTLLKSMVLPQPFYGIINIGNITSWMRADGLSNHSPGGDNGMYYPRGTGNVIYQDCVNWSANLYLDAARTRPIAVRPVRVGGGSYGVGTKNGWVTGQGVTALPVSPDAPSNARAWRVRRDYASMSDAEAAADAASNNEVSTTDVTAAMIASTKAQYDLDWTTWATVIPFGAPYVERNGTPGYQAPPAFTNITDKTNLTFTVDSLIAKNLDEPGIAGIDPNSPADQVIWAAYNDLDVTQALGFEGSEPIGLEISKTMWAYKRSDALGNLYFTKYRLINKGGVDSTAGAKTAFWLDSMYVCQWSDPDLGSFSDDLVGCDTTLSMGFIYNANPVDETFKLYGVAPPAAGYDFLQGPIISAPGDSGVFNLKRRYNVKNLGMSAFAYFSAGSPYSDPPGGTANYQAGTGRWSKMHRGFAPLGDFTNAPVPYASGPFAVSKFPLSGDPVARTGFVDGLGTTFSFAPGDRRLLVITGPFQMAPADTQEIVIGVVVGIGADRLSSVSVLKFNDRFAQNTYNSLFAVTKPPNPPNVKITELDGEIALEWGSNLSSVSDLESRVNNPGNYVFEGYNVYQLPSRGSRLSEGKRIVTFDLPTDPAVIVDEQVDASGVILFKPVQFGSNSGLTRYISFKRDYVRDIDKLWNGQEYYYAVTAYARTTTGYLPATLESSPTVFTARPGVRPGYRYTSKTAQSVTVSHPSGIGDVNINLKVVDPSAVTGATYSINFSTQPNVYGGATDSGDASIAPPTNFNLVGSVTLNLAGTSLAYTITLSNTANAGTLLASPTAVRFQYATGTIVKSVPHTIALGNLTASGTWSSTDGTQPFTTALRDSLLGEKLYVNIATTTDANKIQSQLFINGYPYNVVRGTTTILSNQQNYTVDDTYPVFDGLQLKVGLPVWRNPTSYTYSQTAGTGDAAHFYSGFGYAYSALFPQSTNTTTQSDLVTDLEFRFTGVRIANTRSNGTAVQDTVIISGGSIATIASSNAQSVTRLRIPFELWEVDPGTGRNRQINVVCRDRNANASSPWGSGGRPLYLRMSATGARAYIGSVSTVYTSETDSILGRTAVPRDNPKGTWVFPTAVDAGSTPFWKTGDVVKIKIPNPSVPGVTATSDVYSFVAPVAIAYDAAAAKEDVGKVGVFPNPYYAQNSAETSRFSRFVTFNKLPAKATIRIFNLAGQLVRVIEKNDASQFVRWDLLNRFNFPVASGVYIAHVDMPEIGATQVLKMGIIQEQEILPSF